MTSRLHSVLPKLAIVIVPTMVAVGSCSLVYHFIHTYEIPRGADLFQVVEGKWSWAGSAADCDTNPHAIRFSADRREMLIVHARAFQGVDGRLDSITHYAIISHTRDRVRAVIRGETRLAADSTPVVWDLVLRSPDTYSWHRADWPSFAYAGKIRRCDAP